MAGEPKLLHLHIQALAVDRPGLIALSLNGENWFEVPTAIRDIGSHDELMKVSKVASNANAVKQPPFKPDKPKYRRIKIELTEEIRPFYLDAQFDFVINKEYLEETTEELRHDWKAKKMSGTIGLNAPNEEPRNDANDNDLGQLVRLLLSQKYEDDQKKEEREQERKKEKEFCKLRDLKKLFHLSEYDGKANAGQWMDSFERECRRLEVPVVLNVEALKMFIGKPLTDWYEGNAIKLSGKDWTEWKQSFIETYTAKGWSEVRSALHFRHLGGSLLDFANAKERKLLEVDRNMPEKFRVWEIVCALPNKAQRKIDRSTETFAALVAKLRELDDAYDKRRKKEDRPYAREDRPFARERSSDDRKREWKREIDRDVAKNLFVVKKPCQFCEAIGFKNNFHPIDKCKNKMKYEEMKRTSKSVKQEVNLNEAEDSETDLNSSQNSGCSQLSATSSTSKTSANSKN